MCSQPAPLVTKLERLVSALLPLVNSISQQQPSGQQSAAGQPQQQSPASGRQSRGLAQVSVWPSLFVQVKWGAVQVHPLFLYFSLHLKQIVTAPAILQVCFTAASSAQVILSFYLPVFGRSLMHVCARK